MSRKNRIKLPNGIYHISLKGFSDSWLFRNDEDRNKFLKILKKYQLIYLFTVYEYCILGTHCHLLIYSNGADISKFMHGINQSYAIYYNKQYNRKGHVFGDRFYSRITKDNYDLLNVAAYIHNNPKDIKGYNDCVEKYQFSSFGIYTGIFEDKYLLIDCDFILKIWGNDIIQSRIKFINFVKSKLCIEDFDGNLDIVQLEYLNNKINSPNLNNSFPAFERSVDTEKILAFLINQSNIPETEFLKKYNTKVNEHISFCILLLHGFKGLKYSEIIDIFKTYNLDSMSLKFSRGYDLICKEPYFKQLYYCFLKKFSIPISDELSDE
ncbi:transposase [Clostridium grantii]|uniref:REP element-mobilizing transposase RayT n=1 Tax=Clostridium grantii DSM 8605 TaxID=1121316 RepID=A0A1M5UY09_9CLOT|nr:transposase [Clostridium grantii]SHH67748.1 REP element-mobilizing transposase RayT [Clostridium grantii DSM 8605]